MNPRSVISHGLSSAQSRLWFLDQLDRDSRSYQMARTLKVLGLVDLDALRGAVNAIFRRHEILRSVVASDSGKPSMVVTPCADIEIPLIDISHLDEPSRSARYDQEIAGMRGERIGLDGEPLMRVSVVRLSTDHHVLVLLVHHIIFDEWSRGVFRQELAELYGSIVNRTDEPTR